MGRSASRRGAWAAVGTAAIVAVAAAPAARAGEYDDALAAARAAAAQGRPGRAARLLEEPARRWPQDYPLRLARGGYLLSAGDASVAEDEYRAALDLAPEAVEPRLGLAWAARGRGDVAASRSRFEEVLTRSPASTAARDGLAALGPEHRGWVGLVGSGTAWSGRPGRTWVAGAGLDAGAVLADRWTLGLTYRALIPPTAVTGSGGGGRGRGARASPTEDAEVQHELHGAAGWDRGDSAVGLVAGGLTDPGAASGVLAGAAGALTGTWRGPVELSASAAGSTWDDGATVLQGEARAALHVAGPLWASAGGRGQLSGGAGFGAGLLRLELRGRWSLAAAGELGLQRRPYDLDARALYGLTDDLRWAVRVRTELPVGARFRIVAGADREAYRTLSVGKTLESTATRGWAGVVLSL
jgi:hypothetical protein